MWSVPQIRASAAAPAGRFIEGGVAGRGCGELPADSREPGNARAHHQRRCSRRASGARLSGIANRSSEPQSTRLPKWGGTCPRLRQSRSHIRLQVGRVSVDVSSHRSRRRGTSFTTGAHRSRRRGTSFTTKGHTVHDGGHIVHNGGTSFTMPMNISHHVHEHRSDVSGHRFHVQRHRLPREPISSSHARTSSSTSGDVGLHGARRRRRRVASCAIGVMPLTRPPATRSPLRREEGRGSASRFISGSN